MAEVSASSTEQEPQVQVTGEPCESAADEALVADDLLVEEISIDGMCGVY